MAFSSCPNACTPHLPSLCRQIGLQSTDRDARLLQSCFLQGMSQGRCFTTCTSKLPVIVTLMLALALTLALVLAWATNIGFDIALSVTLGILAISISVWPWHGPGPQTPCSQFNDADWNAQDIATPISQHHQSVQWLPGCLSHLSSCRDVVLGDAASWARCTQQADAVRGATRAQGARAVLIVVQPPNSPDLPDERALQLCKQAGIDRRYLLYTLPLLLPSCVNMWATRATAQTDDPNSPQPHPTPSTHPP